MPDFTMRGEHPRIPPETVQHWCPECDVPRQCLVLSNTCLECCECFELIPTPLPDADLKPEYSE